MRNRLGVIGLLVASYSLTFGAATITIQNNDAAGVGFNDNTVVAPIGGNPGTTIGQQRLNVFQAAAATWGATLTSSVLITVKADWPALTCNANGAVLGSAGATTVHASFTGSVPNYWYPQALANKLLGADISPANADISASFNRNLGQAGCLTGIFFYYGLDGNAPANTVNLLPVLLHELGHGLGFLTETNGQTGAFLGTQQFPSIADQFLYDTTLNTTWDHMTAAQRAASAINNNGTLRWDGPNVKNAAASVLNQNVNVAVTAPASAVATYAAGPTDNFGLSLNNNSVSGELMPISSDACNPLTGPDALAANNKIVLMNYGNCAFHTKVKNAQNAGAKGVVLVNFQTRFPLEHMTDIDPTVTIPSAEIRLADGASLLSALRFRSRTNSGVFVTLSGDATKLAGSDTANRIAMYTPNPLASGSSVSHWDIAASRNLLMEPFSTSTLSLSVIPPQDLTFKFLQDIGW